MKKNNLIIIITLIVLLALVSFYLDSEIVKGVFLIRNAFLSDFFMGITFVSSEIIIFFGLTSLFLWREHKRKFIVPLWITLGLSALVSFILKFGIQRLRPYQLGLVPVLTILEKANHFSWNFSFPSFQAMLVFCAVPILSKEFPKLKYAWIVFAGLVAFSRVYFGLHFLSDVIMGGLIGYLIGMIILKVEKESKFGEKVYKKIIGK
ncbi:undecaprenyl pyrophosphate phosphatase [archaeon BMS3Abin17]|nr:undecaprenyl pyrophosphate phosphatase [archaeon BMS3Abin17]HDZ61029.1 phosphatase PAP2 family protein [Candidatus Pacearchaeota archaeon]